MAWGFMGYSLFSHGFTPLVFAVKIQLEFEFMNMHWKKHYLSSSKMFYLHRDIIIIIIFYNPGPPTEILTSC